MTMTFLYFRLVCGHQINFTSRRNPICGAAVLPIYLAAIFVFKGLGLKDFIFLIIMLLRNLFKDICHWRIQEWLAFETKPQTLMILMSYRLER